jgi:uncharacterized protein YjiS (DUF1127 family)
VTTQSFSSRDNVLGRPQLVSGLRERIVTTLREWRRRVHSRHELSQLSELELKDIGFPARVEAEKAKPFWRE